MLADCSGGSDLKNCKRNRLRAWTFRTAQPPLPPSPTLTVVLREKFWVMGKIAGQLSRFLYRTVSSVTVCDFNFGTIFAGFQLSYAVFISTLELVEMDFTGEGTGWCVSCCSEGVRFFQFLAREEPSGLTDLKVWDIDYYVVRGSAVVKIFLLGWAKHLQLTN